MRGGGRPGGRAAVQARGGGRAAAVRVAGPREKTAHDT